jgi:epidermal growth factor receptor substrate 15
VVHTNLPTAAPLPRFDSVPAENQPQPQPPSAPQSIVQQSTGPPASPSPAGPPPIRVPALSPDKVTTYSSLFEKSGAENGFLSGLTAKQIFERAGLPNEVLGRIWGLSDTQGRGLLDVTEFVIAMHLLASYKSGQMRGVPSTLPPGLYEAATRRPPVRAGSGSRPGSSAVPNIPPQFTGFNQRPQSPITRQQVSTPLSAQSTGEAWLVSPADKARFDSIFATIDRQGRGFITGEQAVEFFGNARLPEEVLAQIWDLADINSVGQLSKEEFAVAMYLIRQQRGTKDGRGVLPNTLPLALIPPSMRKQALPPSQPTAPAFENAPITKPRSAADDLFGLDAFGPPPTIVAQVPQSTGGTDAGPFANPPSALSPQTTSTTFKPFIPSSSFGQSMIPQSTGSPAPAQTRSPPPTDDLLGDADPEISSKLTNETSELGNLSNQIGSLSKQMTELQGTRKQTEQELSHNTAQKRAFEGRLAQLRSLYEKEVKEVRALQEQLTVSKNETKRLQSDMAMVDGTHQDLSTQHQQLRSALEADQRENAALKERIRQSNQEIDQLRPQLEKLKSDARQQKGLVAINKKQLATNETERDRIKAEITAAQKQVEDAAREAEESAREVEESKRELEEARNIPIPSVKSPPAVASPAPSTSSNPFFRKTTDTTFTPTLASPEPTNNQNAFDSIFGPSFGTSSTAPVPQTSFSSQSPPPGGSPNIPRIESPESTTPSVSAEPPAPPQSRQITSSSLPFRQPLQREDSISSSVKVAAPVSRLSPADTPRALTPGTSTPSPPAQGNSADPFATVAAPDEEQESVRRTLPEASASKESLEDSFGKTSVPIGEIPGAFPAGSRSDTPSHGISNATIVAGAGVATLASSAGLAAAITNGTEQANNDSLGKGKAAEQNFDDFFGGPPHQRTTSQQAADFDSAFADFGKPQATNGTQDVAAKEFPDIQEVVDDDDDTDSEYSDEPLKFDDDFNTRSPPRDLPTDSKSLGKQPEGPASPNDLSPLRPPLDTAVSTASSLPGVDQQKSPPTYGDTVPNDNPTHFPREYKGLLPEREDPTSPPAGGETIVTSPPGGSGEPPSYGPEAHPRSPSESKATAPFPLPKTASFDFDSAFAGVGAAPVADDDDDSEDEAQVFSPARNQADFDPTFDSPPESRSSAVPQHSVYDSVTNGTSSSKAAANDPFKPNGAAPSFDSQPTPVADSHDWDALFAPLNTTTGGPQVGPTASAFDPPGTPPGASATASAPSVAVAEPSSPPAPTSPTSATPTAPSAKLDRPQPGRALSTGTEHDDPILKRLTAMGWSREESLTALEKFDYNIDKVS